MLHPDTLALIMGAKKKPTGDKEEGGGKAAELKSCLETIKEEIEKALDLLDEEEGDEGDGDGY